MPPKAVTVAITESDWNMVLALLSQKGASDFDMHKAAADLGIKAPALGERWSRFQIKYQAQLNSAGAAGPSASSAAAPKFHFDPKLIANKFKGKGGKVAKNDDSESDVGSGTGEETQKAKGKKKATRVETGSEEDDENEEAE